MSNFELYVQNYSKLLSANLINTFLIYSAHDYECFDTSFMSVLQKLWKLESITTVKSPIATSVFLSKREIVACVN